MPQQNNSNDYQQKKSDANNKRREDELDEADRESFPASDAPAIPSNHRDTPPKK